MVPARSYKVSRVSYYSGSCCASLPSLTGLSPSLVGLPSTILFGSSVTSAVRTPECKHSGLGSSAFARRYLRNHFCFLFLRLLRCFSSPGALLSKRGDSTTTAGFPHSEICGSLVTCTSPQLIAAYRVLLRLIWPRHPPYALTYLTYLLSFLRFELSNFLKRSFSFLTFSCSCQGTEYINP